MLIIEVSTHTIDLEYLRYESIETSMTHHAAIVKLKTKK
jgi:hypothetical protein